MNEPTSPELPRKKGLKWWLMLVLLWFPLGLAGGNIVLSALGVCISQARYRTNDELIEIAVRANADREKVGEHIGMAIDGSEASIQQFLKDNPKCCRVDRSAMQSRGWLDLLVGWNAPWVELNYELYPMHRASHSDRYYKQFFVVNTCGEALGFEAGMSTPTLEAAR
ncbi:MAG: hypothetical protein Q7T21_02595 [Gallionella sp.]|nr:hypothetical protein [Gallionella sp.]